MTVIEAGDEVQRVPSIHVRRTSSGGCQFVLTRRDAGRNDLIIGLMSGRRLEQEATTYSVLRAVNMNELAAAVLECREITSPGVQLLWEVLLRVDNVCDAEIFAVPERVAVDRVLEHLL